jgi:hypothetical protein|tara:strand:+ start:520 stop:672 length:153 start_codon:yes stop_codon:yes gene_type:complete
LTKFEKSAIIAELISDKFEMVETDDTKVLDTTKLSSNEKARLKQIIEASK